MGRQILAQGLFIVVEGLDNVGKTTFIDYFCKQNPLVSRRKFPSKAVSEVMNRIQFQDINWKNFHDMFHKDLEIGINTITEELQAGISVICDRYIYSHWAYENLRRNGKSYDCEFLRYPMPDIIVYLRPNDINLIQKADKDNLEAGIDYEEGQKEFDRILKPWSDRVLTIPALQPDTNDNAVAAIVKKHGVFL